MKQDTKLSPQGYLYENDGALHPFWEQDGGGGGTGTVPDITATATVDGTTGTPSVEVTQSGNHGENIDFAFSGLKGEKGDKGDVGPQGPEGPQGPKGEDGTSVIPANIVKNVTMDATPNVTMGTTDYDLAYRTNDDQKHNAQTLHVATKQLVLENAQTTAGTSSTDKIGEITLYTIDQTGNTGSQAFGIVAITQTDGSVSLCPAINKDGTWEYGQEFLKIPSVPQNYVKEAYIGNPTIEGNMQYYSLRKIMVRDGVEQAESHENFGTFDPEHMVENVLIDSGLTAPSGKYTTNKATFKSRWNHGGVVTEQTDVYAVNAPIADKNYTDVTMTSATTDSGTTYSLKKTDMDGKEANIGTIEVPKAGGGGGGITMPEYLINGSKFTFDTLFKYQYQSTTDAEMTVTIPLFAPNGVVVPSQSGDTYLVLEDGTSKQVHYYIEGYSNDAETYPGFVTLLFNVKANQQQDSSAIQALAGHMVHCNGNSILKVKSYTTKATANAIISESKKNLYAEHNLSDVVADKKHNLSDVIADKKKEEL